MNNNDFTWAGFDQKNKAHQTLMGFLLLDVQYSSQYADELKADINAYRSGTRTSFDGSGNGYEFECLPEGFYINCLYEGDALTPVTIDYQTVEKALSEWGEYCRRL